METAPAWESQGGGQNLKWLESFSAIWLLFLLVCLLVGCLAYTFAANAKEHVNMRAALIASWEGGAGKNWNSEPGGRDARDCG